MLILKQTLILTFSLLTSFIYLFIYCFCGRSLAHLHLQMFSHCGKTTVLPVLSYIHRYQEVTV